MPSVARAFAIVPGPRCTQSLQLTDLNFRIADQRELNHCSTLCRYITNDQRKLWPELNSSFNSSYSWAVQAACWCYNVPKNPMTFPAPVPEIPAANVEKAAAYYVNTLGFTLDWGDDQGGIAGISRGNCRLFITNRSFRESHGNTGPILFWLNLDSKAEVDELFAQWKAAQAKIVSEPEDKPWKLREFMAADLDGNLIRVFYDFRGDM
jgi:uncharacterized glyoxalase superfamily protein PhnB